MPKARWLVGRDAEPQQLHDSSWLELIVLGLSPAPTLIRTAFPMTQTAHTTMFQSETADLMSAGVSLAQSDGQAPSDRFAHQHAWRADGQVLYILLSLFIPLELFGI